MSITQIKNRLPKEFIEELYEKYSPLTVDQLLIAMSEKRQTTLRVNTIKSNVQTLMQYFKEENIKFERVDFYKDAFIIKNANEKQLQKLPIYEEGNIYLQSLSSMMPPLILNPKPEEKVLDMTAAPGSKTTQMAALMENKGYLLANELDKIRQERLQHNVIMQGADVITKVVEGRGEKLGENYPQFFDKILLDAPCSGEGRFIACNPGTYRDWSKKKVLGLVKVQKKLLKSAYQALKIGGTMVYSTCTLNEQENEEVLQWAIENFPLELVETDIHIKEAIPAVVKNRDASIKKATRILPSKRMEGFFIAKIQKKG